MSLFRNRNAGRLVIPATMAAFLLTGCAAKKAWWGDPDNGLTLEYRFPAKSRLAYKTTNEFKQTMNVMGQSMDVTSSGMTAFSFAPAASPGDVHALEVTMDSMSISVSSPRGELTPDTGPVIGKQFTMTLSLLGKELDVSGAERIEYDMGAEGKRNMSSQFQAFFPDLPGRPVKVGDTWATADTIFDKGGGGETQLIFNGVNTLIGFETVNGMECARITSYFTGTLNGKGQQGGMQLTSAAEIKGIDTWFFAYKKGIFVRNSTEATVEGIIKGSGIQEITIPMTRNFTIKTELVGK